MESFVEYCKSHIENNIYGYTDQSHYGSDLCYTITEGMNADGSCTYSRAEAIEYLKEWWDEAADYYDYHKDNFGEAPTNPFEDPEGYMVCMVIRGCSSLLSRVSLIEDNWNDEFVLTDQDCDKILEEIKDIRGIVF